MRADEVAGADKNGSFYFSLLPLLLATRHFLINHQKLKINKTITYDITAVP